MERIDRNPICRGKTLNGLTRPVEERTKFEQVAIVDREQSGPASMLGLVRSQSDNPARRAGKRAVERLYFADTATG